MRESDKPTGLWLGELVHFYDYIDINGYQIYLFNIKGGNTPIDPVNLNTFTLENHLKEHGANYSKSKIPFRPYVKTTNRLVTGQNPQSPKQVAQAVSNLLR
ncbi:hypothetical protein [Staphylococcus succinus]|uniref:hypothetical protein n=1 Tax=Staphylococcus succinus TaxID=61015 RepID=UPI000E683DB4|nr:hypothetical protein [Staphylococcus succinus]RIN39064.1 hypothetical protein BU059_13105 [Staphylococcus succinus]